MVVFDLRRAGHGLLNSLGKGPFFTLSGCNEIARSTLKWPTKSQREEFEIAGFVEAYQRLPEARKFEIVLKSEKPDYIVRDVGTAEELGVELTSVYLNERSVPDVHMRECDGLVEIPYNRKELEQYYTRLIAAIQHKICKARNGYSSDRPLILAVYLNEYISIHIQKPELEALTLRYQGLFDSMSPFSEVVFWNLGNGGVFRVTSS